MRLNDLIETRQDQCAKCISYVYTLSCNVDLDLCKKLRIFGRELYPISVIGVFKVEEADQFFVECILNSRYLKIWFSKSLGDQINVRLRVLNDCLIEWFSDKLDSDIELG